MTRWFVYIIECRDGSLYTGIAVDVERRLQQHIAGKGARYTRSHPPLRLLGSLELSTRSQASRAEYAIKQMSPSRKRTLCDEWTIQSPGQDACAPHLETRRSLLTAGQTSAGRRCEEPIHPNAQIKMPRDGMPSA